MKRRKFLVESKKITIDEGFEKFINSKTALNRAKDTIDYYEDTYYKYS